MATEIFRDSEYDHPLCWNLSLSEFHANLHHTTLSYVHITWPHYKVNSYIYKENYFMYNI